MATVLNNEFDRAVKVFLTKRGYMHAQLKYEPTN